MSKKAPKTTTKPAIAKFEKNAFYEDGKGNLWQCVNGKTRKAPDGNVIIDMRTAQNGEATGEPSEEYADTFVKKLTQKELKEYREVAKREAAGLADAAAEKTETTSTRDGWTASWSTRSTG